MRSEFNLFFIVYYFLLVNWLIIHFSRWGLIFFGNGFFSVLSRSYNFRMINNCSILLLNIENLFDYSFLGLNIFLSYCSSSWNSDRNWSSDYLIVDYGSIHNFFCINWSFDFCSSYNRCLNNPLFDDRLRDNFLSYDGLWNYSSLDDWLRNDFLSLCNVWSWIKYLSILSSALLINSILFRRGLSP